MCQLRKAELKVLKFTGVPEKCPPSLWNTGCRHDLGDATFLLPGAGELGDLAFAPFEALALRSLFGGGLLSILGFAEEALPFTDALPTATTGWVLQTLFSDSPLAQLLGIQPLEMDTPNTKKPERDQK